MDHALVAEDAEEATDEGEDVDEAKDCDSDQESLLLRLQLQGFQRQGGGGEEAGVVR